MTATTTNMARLKGRKAGRQDGKVNGEEFVWRTAASLPASSFAFLPCLPPACRPAFPFCRPARLPCICSRSPTALVLQANVADHHRLVDGLDHVVDRQ